MRMSQKRADAVAKVLVQDLGIDAARVTAKGFGKTRPIATNATKEGRERNRRVVAVVVPGPAPGKSQQPAATAQTGTRG
jgi:OOP family OmpA-OmpF porin